MDKFVVRKPLGQEVTKGLKRVTQLCDADEPMLVWLIYFLHDLFCNFHNLNIYILFSVVMENQVVINQVQQSFQRLHQLAAALIFQMLITKALIQLNTKFYHTPKPFHKIMNFQNNNLAKLIKESHTCIPFL